MMFGNQLIYGTGLIIVMVIFHVIILMWLAAILKRWEISYQIFDSTFGTMLAFGFSVFIIIGIHTAEAWFWAYIYVALGEFSGIQDALYFSVATSTTLGYGDVVLSEQWRLLGSFEAMGGLLLFGASTAFLVGLMRYVFSDTNSGAG